MPEFVFDGKATLAALRSLADLLAARAVEHQTLIIVGGSYLVLNSSLAPHQIPEQRRRDRTLL